MEINKKLNLEVRNIFLQGRIQSIAGDALRCTVLFRLFIYLNPLTLVGSFRSSSKMLMNIIWREKCKCSYHRQWHKEHREWHTTQCQNWQVLGFRFVRQLWRRDKNTNCELHLCCCKDKKRRHISRFSKFVACWFLQKSFVLERDQTQIMSCTLLYIQCHPGWSPLTRGLVIVDSGTPASNGGYIAQCFSE